MELKNRLKLFLKTKKISQRKFEMAIGKSNGYVNNIVKTIGADVVNAIRKAYPDLNIDWLISGEGEMLNERQPTIELKLIPQEEKEGEFFLENSHGSKFYDLGNGNYRMTVKLVPFCAYGRFANEADVLEPDKEEWEEESFEISKIVHGKYLAFQVKGDSMDDGTRESFEAGDRVLVKELDRVLWLDKLRYTDYPYWVVVFDSSVLIKQIINHDTQTGMITFHSLNPSPEYCDFQLCVDNIRKLYYVVQKKPRVVHY